MDWSRPARWCQLKCPGCDCLCQIRVFPLQNFHQHSLLQGGIELRMADGQSDTIRRAAAALRPVAQDRGVAFLLSEQPALARRKLRGEVRSENGGIALAILAALASSVNMPLL